MAGAPDGLVIVSEEQTGGRGRRGRSFQSPKGKGLYLTALLRPKLPPSQVTDFTAWVAVAVCDGIQAACGVRPRIKWTNRLGAGRKKAVRYSHGVGAGRGEQCSGLLNYRHRRQCQPHPRRISIRRCAPSPPPSPRFWGIPSAGAGSGCPNHPGPGSDVFPISPE